MAAGTYVGRVGGLAIALGIGTALVTGWNACPAWADGGSTASASSSSASSHPAKKAKKAEHRVSHAKSETKSEAKGGTKAGTEGGSKSEAKTASRVEAKSVAATNIKPDTAAKAGKVEAKARVRAEKRAAAQQKSEPASTAPATAAVTATTAIAATGTAEAATATPQSAMAPVAVSRSTVVAAARTAADPALPDTSGTALVALAAVREERRTLTAKAVAAAAAQSVSATAVPTAVTTSSTASTADSTPNILLIGIDGTNLSKILANPANVNLFALMQGGTTAASNIEGHTTMSNPSWTAILTGLWGETTGVVNNLYNPDVYKKWPTVFDQLEALNPNIETTAIANWDVVSAIAASGSVGADHITNIAQLAGDSNWSKTDNAVGEATVAAIQAANPNNPNFIFSYFVGVDENGHNNGGGSQQYADAITNVDRNIGEIMQTVSEWEAATGEKWTVIVVTDHGHQGSAGLGHGFQSPNETSTFVIANNPDLFTAGGVNSAYKIVDVTPTIVTLFGGTPAKSNGVPLTTLGSSTTVPTDNDTALRTALQAALKKQGYPGAEVVLTQAIRTVATIVPYGVNLVANTITDELQSIAAQHIFLVSTLAQLLSWPVQLIGDLAYAATNIVAEAVAFLTGVTGATIFPLFVPSLPPLVGSADTQAPASACSLPGACLLPEGSGLIAA